MAKKIIARKKHVTGQGAPRNKLEPPVENYPGSHGGRDTPMARKNWSERKQCAAEAPMKKLIGQEMSNKQQPKKNAPSVVARLMGVDTLPSHAKPTSDQVDEEQDSHASSLINETLAKSESIGRLSGTKSARHNKSFSFDSIEENIPDRWSYGKTGNKPKRREHPQEEELQKFKKEFEAWLGERVKKCSKTIEIGKTPSQWLARENLNNEKILRMMENGNTLETSLHERVVLQNKAFKDKYSAAQKCESLYLRNGDRNINAKLSLLKNSDRLAEDALAPSKIVILRPGPDRLGTYEECLSSPGTSLGRSSIEDFLEEVKERLKHEARGKNYKKGSPTRGDGIKTHNENISDPKQIAQRIARHVRESVTRDLGMNLFRSESTRSYRSDFHVNEANAPEFISRDTRKLLVDRLRNVLKEETNQNVPDVPKSKRSPQHRHRTQSLPDVSNSKNKLRHLDSLENVSDMQSRSFRREDNGKGEIHEEISPRNLIRSLSAPVSGTSFGKLLLEDRHIITGAHIRRKHEATEKATMNETKRKKEKFNLKEKVTNLKQSFTRKGSLFGRKSQSSEEEHVNGHDIMEDNPNDSSMIMNFYDQPENFTEVPPSPASACSSTHEESFQPTKCTSPTSNSDVTSIGDSLNPNIFREISSNIKDIRRQLDAVETDDSEDTMPDEQSIQADLPEIEDQAEAYIRDLLLVSGLYDASFYRSISRQEPLGKPISIQVFEELEESCIQKTNVDEGPLKDHCEKSSHKLLFDLVNETLPNVLGPTLQMSKCARNATSAVLQIPPHGKKLFNQLMQILRVYLHPSTDKAHFSLDRMVGRELQSSTWSRLMDDDVNDLGKDIECQITGDLIGEMVKDMVPKRRARKNRLT